MSQLYGTHVSDTLYPFDTTDTYATHDALYGKGGFRSVNTTQERDAITSDRRTPGMFVYVVDVQKLYVLSNNVWEEWSNENGGDFRTVNTIQDRNSITDKKNGMFVYVVGEQKLYVYKQSDNSWEEWSSGQGESLIEKYTFNNQQTWNIQHNLNTFPPVHTVNTNGEIIIGNVTYINSNSITISFSESVSGYAYVSQVSEL